MLPSRISSLPLALRSVAPKQALPSAVLAGGSRRFLASHTNAPLAQKLTINGDRLWYVTESSPPPERNCTGE